VHVAAEKQGIRAGLLTAAGQAPHLAGGRVRVVESSNKGLRIERKRIRHQQEVRLLRRRDTEELFPGGGLIRTPGSEALSTWNATSSTPAAPPR